VAVLLTALLLIPWVGALLAAGLLAVIGARYGEAVLGEDFGDDDGTPGPGPFPAWAPPPRQVAGAVAALAAVAPVVLRPAGLPPTPRWATAAILGAAAVLCWVVLPLAAMAVSRARLPGPAGVRAALAPALCHRLATPGALLVVPLGLAALEVATIAVAVLYSFFPLLTLDVLPRSETVAVLGGHPGIASGNIDPDELPLSVFGRIYAGGLLDGYTLVGAVPLSLANGLHWRDGAGYDFLNVFYWELWVNPVTYLAFRAVCTALGVTALLTLVELQARWLGRIAAADS
jgi:hypothetical protein